MFPFLIRSFRPWASDISFENSIQIVFQEDDSQLHDRTNFLDSPGQFNWSLKRQQTGTATITLKIAPDQAYAPQIDWPVWIYEVYAETETRTCVFSGTISDVEIEYFANQGHHTITLACVTPEAMFDSIQTPTGEFTGNAGDIFQSLFDSGTYPLNVTVGTLETGANLSSRKYDAKTSLKSAFDQLATDTGFIWYFDPRTSTVNFHDPTTVPGPFTLSDGMALWNSMKWKQSKSNFRDRQVIQMDPNMMPASNVVFVGDGVETEFAIPDAVKYVVSAVRTTSTQATVVGTFSGQPLDGDTVTITPPFTPSIAQPPYTFVDELDNSVYGQVKIGADEEETRLNLGAAINGDPTLAGTGYSLPTWANQQVMADASASSPATAFVLRAKRLGREGNTIAVASSSVTSPPAFTWNDVTLSGGADRTTRRLSVGPLGTGSYDVYFTPGATTVITQSPVPIGEYLVVNYRGSNSGLITVSNGAAADLGVNSKFQVMFARGSNTLDAALQQAAAALASYSTLPATFSFVMDIPGIFPGMYVPVSLTVPVGAPALLNGNWIVQSVSGSLPAPGWEKLPDNVEGPHGRPEPGGHFRYAIEMTNTIDTPTEQDFWRDLADAGPSNDDVPETPPEEIDEQIHSLYMQFNTLALGADVIQHQCVAVIGKGIRVVAVLRVAISADLVIEVKKKNSSGTVTWEVTIPAATAVDEPVEVEIEGDFMDKDILYAGITASDETTTDSNGVLGLGVHWA